MNMARTIFIGDVHGCLDELRILVERLDLHKQDRVILLGDLINRGPDSAGVVRYVAEKGFECILGNHEEDFLHSDQKLNKYKSLAEQLKEPLLRFLESLPLYIEEERFIAVHAGLQPDRHPAKTKREVLLNIRTWDGNGKDLFSPELPPWYDLYQGPKTVFYGHWARQGLNIREKTVGLDSGCVYGNSLSAYILEERRVVQVKAKRRHYIPLSERELQLR